MHSLSHIESLTKTLADARDQLSRVVLKLQLQIQAAQAAALPKIKAEVAETSAHHSALWNAIDQSRDLFVRPRTVVFHGIQLGLRKSPGAITWDEDQKVCDLIAKHFPKSQADLLIKTTQKPIAKALEDLDATDLKRIGCRILNTSDQIIIKPTDDAVDHIVTALLADALHQTTQDAQEAA